MLVLNTAKAVVSRLQQDTATFTAQLLHQQLAASPAIKVRLWATSRERSTTSKSPLWMPTPSIESPEALRKNIASELGTMNSWRLMCSSI